MNHDDASSDRKPTDSASSPLLPTETVVAQDVAAGVYVDAVSQTDAGEPAELETVEEFQHSTPSASIGISSTRRIDRDALISLYDAVGWTAYTEHPEDFGPMIDGAWLVLSAWEGSQLVGLARVVGDGATVAYLQDLLVHPARQRRGIGNQLLQAVLTRTENIRQVYVTTDDVEENRHVVELYRSARIPDDTGAGNHDARDLPVSRRRWHRTRAKSCRFQSIA